MDDNIWKEAEVEAFNMPQEENVYTGTHMIDSLTPAAVYVAKVSSRNVYGYSAPSKTFKFATRGAGELYISMNIFAKFWANSVREL